MKAKRNQKLMIVIVSAVMVFSGLYLGLSGPSQGQRAQPVDYSGRILQYNVYPVGNASVPVRIDGPGEDLILMFNQPGSVGEETLISIFSENFTSVKNSTFEESGAYSFFKFQTENTSKTAQSIRNILRARTYSLYKVYNGTTSAGRVSVIGNDLKQGDYVKVLLFQRTLSGVFDLLGFSQGVVPYGNVVVANLTNITGVLYNGILIRFLDESMLKGGINASELQTEQPRLVIDAANYSVSIKNASVLYDQNRTIVEARDYGSLTVELETRNISFEKTAGRMSFIAPIGSNGTMIERMLNDSGVLNVSVNRVGLVAAPPEITDGNRLIRIPNSRMLDAMVKDDAAMGEEINVSLSIISLGDYNLVFAKQV